MPVFTPRCALCKVDDINIIKTFRYILKWKSKGQVTYNIIAALSTMAQIRKHDNTETADVKMLLNLGIKPGKVHWKS